MADRKHFFKEKTKKEQNIHSYEEKIRKNRRKKFYRILFPIIVVVLILVVIQLRKRVYVGYDTTAVVERQIAADARDVRLGNTILTYSRDGVHCTDTKGNIIWNQTYQMQDIRIATCRNTVAIGNYNGREIYVGNSEKFLGSITTTMPLRNMAVAANGNVTAIMADTDATWINTYSPEGELLYTGQTHMNNSGYPVAVSLSPDGELLGVSYAYVDAGVIKTNIAFYNFGPIGSNQSDYLVSVHTYTDLLVPHIQFLNEDTAFAVGDSRLMIYKGNKKPVPVGEYLYSQQVQSVFYSDKYIGLVFLSDETENRYRMHIYDGNAKEIGNYYFDTEYSDIILCDDHFIVYNEQECEIITYGGVKKFHGNFTKTVDKILPTRLFYKYVLVTDRSLDTIRLK